MEQTVRENNKTLYSPKFEHDNCGIGAVVNIKGIKSHDTVANALTIVETLEHRAGKDAEGKTGDGAGILLQISHKFYQKAADIGVPDAALNAAKVYKIMPRRLREQLISYQ